MDEILVKEKGQFVDEKIDWKHTKEEKEQLLKLVKTEEEELEIVLEYLQQTL